MELDNEKPFGKHHRATVYSGSPNYEDIVSANVSGDYITSLPNTHEKKGKLLVMSRLHDLTSYHLKTTLIFSVSVSDTL